MNSVRLIGQDYFDVDAPSEIESGVPFDITIQAKDGYGNNRNDITGLIDVNLSVDGIEYRSMNYAMYDGYLHVEDYTATFPEPDPGEEAIEIDCISSSFVSDMCDREKHNYYIAGKDLAYNELPTLIYSALTGILNGCIRQSGFEESYDGTAVAFFGDAGNYVEWYPVSAASRVYANIATHEPETGTNQQASIYVNGEYRGKVYTTGYGGWLSPFFDTTVLNTTIPAGATVRLQIDSDDAIANYRSDGSEPWLGNISHIGVS